MTDQLLLWWAKLEVLWPLAIGAGVLVLVVAVVVSQVRFTRGKRNSSPWFVSTWPLPTLPPPTRPRRDKRRGP